MSTGLIAVLFSRGSLQVLLRNSLVIFEVVSNLTFKGQSPSHWFSLLRFFKNNECFLVQIIQCKQ